MRRGVRLAFDVGKVRIGVASCDADGILCSPVETLHRDRRGNDHIHDAADIVAEYEPIEIIVGLPKNMDGSEGPAAKDARRFATQLSLQNRNIGVRLVDERLTTVAAHRNLHAAGRSERSHRAVIDQEAAALILRLALDIEESTGRPPGEPAAGGRKG